MFVVASNLTSHLSDVLDQHPLLCGMVRSFPSAGVNKNRWDIHHRLLSEEIVSSCFSYGGSSSANTKSEPPHPSDVKRENKGEVDLTYRGRSVRMSVVKRAVRATIRYKLFDVCTSMLDYIATALHAIHTSSGKNAVIYEYCI